MKDKKEFGAFIKEKRIEKNFSQKELAEHLFVTESAVSKWERGVTYPDITLITDICRLLEITEHELIESSHDVEYRKMKKEAIKYNRLKVRIFWTLNVCYLIALLTCFIVNLAVSHTLSWFFIVLTSILCGYSFCPTFIWLVPKFKKIVFIGSTFTSMFLLFLTCSIYTDKYWFMIPTVGVLLGYFIIFHPILVLDQKRYLDLNKYKKISKAFLLTYSIGILVLINLLLVTICLYEPFNLTLAMVIATGCMLLPIIIGVMLIFNNGKTMLKVFLLILSVIIVIGIFIGLGNALYIKTTEESRVYNIEESFNKISIDVKTTDVNIHLSDFNENKIVSVETDKVFSDIKVVDDVLVITKIDNRKFYEHLFDFTSRKIDIYLSKDSLETLNINGSTGDIFVDTGFTFSNANINISTGDLEFESNVTNDLAIEVSTGDVEIYDSLIGGKLSIKTSTGDVELENVKCHQLNMIISTGEIDLTNVLITENLVIEGGTGDVSFNSIDAANIDITVSTGDVSGTILSSKFFIVHSSSGECNVPQTKEGGTCRIKASTGDIYIQYK